MEAYQFQQAHYGCVIPSLDVLIKARRQAQALAATSTVGGAWSPLGPQPVNTGQVGASYGDSSGRITAVAVNPQNSNDIWAGAANGGLWSSANGGHAWVPEMDSQVSLSVGSIAMDPNAPNTLYVGTGEPNGSDSYWGMGILKTTDGGGSWITGAQGLPLGFSVFAGLSVSKIIVDPTNSQDIFAATCCITQGISVPGGNPNPSTGRGVWRSTDGGMTWAALLGGPNGLGANGDVTDLVWDPAQPGTLFAGVANGNVYDTSSVYMTTDFGANWQALVGLPPASAVARVSLGIAHNGADVYAALGEPDGSVYPPQHKGSLLNQAMYISTNGGASFSAMPVPQAMWEDQGANSNTQFQWDYNSVVAVDPTNPCTVYAGGVDLWQSTNGGGACGGTGNWTNITLSYLGGSVHPDQHALAFVSPTSSAYVLGNDGGVWQSNAYGTGTFSNLNDGGLNITQFYGGSIGSAGGNAQLYGASQDNGTDAYPPGSVSGAQAWNEVLGGDGYRVAVDPTTNGTVYAEVPSASSQCPSCLESLQESANGGASGSWSSVFDIPQSELKVAGPIPMMLSPNNHAEWLLATDRLHKSASSPALPQFGSSDASALAVAPGDDSRIYVGVGASGSMYMSTDGGQTFAHMNAPSRSNGDALMTGLAVDPNAENTVYATYSMYPTSGSCPQGATGCQHVFKTTDAGASWTDISTTLPNAPFESVIAVAKPTTGCTSCQPLSQLVAGSDVGVFTSADGGATWSVLGTGLPFTQVDQVFADASGTTVYTATHGRGMWSIPLSAPLHVYLATANIGTSQPPNTFYALDALSGTTTWAESAPASAEGAALANGVFYTAETGVGILALDASSGSLLWSYPYSNYLNGPTVANGLVYFGGYDGYEYALNANTGALVWRSACLCKAHNAPLQVGAPTFGNGLAYVGANEYYVYALNATTGATVWSYQNKTGANGDTYGDGMVYVGTGNSSAGYYMTALNAANGRVVWSFSTFLTDSSLPPDPPTVANGVVYFLAQTYELYALNASTGAQIWRDNTIYDLANAPTVVNGILYIGMSNAEQSEVDAFDASTGTLIWSYPTPAGGGFLASPVVDNGVAYSGDTIDGVRALNAATGALIWVAPGSAPGPIWSGGEFAVGP